jgi:4a-hydroxytetrahydrobiopterin dehydratase
MEMPVSGAIREATMPLSKQEINDRLSSLPGWEFDDDEIQREYKLASFREAIEFVNRIAGEAEQMDHHPDIEIKYDRVKIELSTHSAGGVTDKDFELARRIDAVAAG